MRLRFSEVWSLAWTRDRQHRWRQVVLPLGAFLATLALLVGGAAINAASKADQRNNYRMGVLSTSETSGVRVVSRGPIWHGRQIAVHWLEPLSPDAPVPLGLTRLPMAGTAVISPGLRRDGFAADPMGLRIDTAAGAGPGGVIGKRGVATSSEYLIYARPAPGRSLGAGGSATAIASFGVPAGASDLPVRPLEVDATHPNERRESVTSLLLFGLPALAIAGTTSRVMSTTLMRRAFALRRLGMRRRTVRAFVVAETALLSLPGAVTAVALYGVVAPHVEALPGAGVRYWRGEFVMPLGWVVLLAAVVLVAQAVVSQSVLRSRGPSRTHPRFHVGALAARLILPGAVTAAGAVAMYLARGQRSPHLLWGGLFLTVIGLGSAMRWATQSVARALSRTASAPRWLAALRMSSARLGLHRPATLIAGLLLLAIAWTGLQALVLAPNFEASSDRGGGFTLSWRGPEPGDLARLRATLPGTVVLPMDSDNRILVEDCEYARAALPGATCAPGDPRSEQVSALSASVGRPVAFGPADEALAVDGHTSVFVNLPDDEGPRVEAAANREMPGVSTDAAIPLAPPLRLRWIVPGGASAAALLLLGFLIAFGNRLLSQVAIDDGLLKAGLSRQDVRAVQRIEAIVPLVTATLLGSALGIDFLYAATSLELARSVWNVMALEVLGVFGAALVTALAIRRLQDRWLGATRRG